MIRQAVVALALWAVASEPEALLGDECEDEHCAFSALQRRGVRKENFEDFKVDEDALARFMEESVKARRDSETPSGLVFKAQSLAQVDEEVELDEAMHVNYTHLLSMGRCLRKPHDLGSGRLLREARRVPPGALRVEKSFIEASPGALLAATSSTSSPFWWRTTPTGLRSTSRSRRRSRRR